MKRLLQAASRLPFRQVLSLGDLQLRHPTPWVTLDTWCFYHLIFMGVNLHFRDMNA